LLTESMVFWFLFFCASTGKCSGSVHLKLRGISAKTVRSW